MAHEVLKRVGANAYRYRVENYRDPATGKVRGRWTYLGKAPAAGDGAAAPAPRRRSSDSRERLLAALGREAEAVEVRERALALAANPAERDLIARGLSL